MSALTNSNSNWTLLVWRLPQEDLKGLCRHAPHTLQRRVTRIPALCRLRKHHQAGTRGNGHSPAALGTPAKGTCAVKRHVPQGLAAYPSTDPHPPSAEPRHRRTGRKPAPGACCLTTCQGCAGSAVGERYHITTPVGLITTEKLSSVFKPLMIFPLYTSCTWKTEMAATRISTDLSS